MSTENGKLRQSITIVCLAALSVDHDQLEKSSNKNIVVVLSWRTNDD